MPRTRSKDSNPPFEVFTMPGTRVRRYVALVLSMVATFGCGDYSQSTSPPPAARKLVPTFVLTSPFSLVPRGSMAQAVRWGPDHQAVDQRVSAVIGAGGGTLSLPGADFSMTIPAGALMEPTAITIVAKGGPHVVYDMSPHGLKFLLPVTAVQGLSTTTIYRTPDANLVRTAYLPDGNEQIRRDGFASPSELQRAKTYFYGDQAIAETQEWILNHFSRYILISGVWTEVDDDADDGTVDVQSIGLGFPIGIVLPETIGLDLPDK
jgi:hypothetical protein